MAKKALTKCSTCRKERQVTVDWQDRTEWVNWREEYIALLKQVYPRRWRDELFNAEVRASARAHNYSPRRLK